MNLTAAALKLMASKGLSLEDVAEIVAANEAPSDSAAERRRAWDRQRKANKRAEESGGMSGGNPPDPAPNEIDNLTPTRKISEPNGSSSKNGICFPADWVTPSPADLTPKARACAEQWTRESYDTEAEGFALYWRQSRKRRPDWKATWCGWVIRQHSKVMRDQKFGTAPRDAAKKITDPSIIALNKRATADLYDKMGRCTEAADLRREAQQLERRVA